MKDKIIEILNQYIYTGNEDMGPSIPVAWFENLAKEIASLYTTDISEEERIDLLAMKIVNQLYELAGLSSEHRQQLNDNADDIVKSAIKELNN